MINEAEVCNNIYSAYNLVSLCQVSNDGITYARTYVSKKQRHMLQRQEIIMKPYS